MFSSFRNVNRWSCYITAFCQFVLLSHLTLNLFYANRRQWICFSHVRRRCCFVSIFRWFEFKSSTSFHLIIVFFFNYNENFASIVSLMMYDNKYDFIIFITFFFVLIVEILLRLHDVDYKYKSFDKFRFFIVFVKFTFCSKKKYWTFFFFNFVELIIWFLILFRMTSKIEFFLRLLKIFFKINFDRRRRNFRRCFLCWKQTINFVFCEAISEFVCLINCIYFDHDSSILRSIYIYFFIEIFNRKRSISR